MKRLATILLTASCSLTAAQGTFQASTERLAKTEVFAFGGVGFAGTTSQGEKDFRIMLTQSPAAALDSFERLYAIANAQGRLYALAGIRKLDPNRFKKLMVPIRDSKEPVRTMSGCIADKRTLGEVVKEIDSGEYDPWVEPRKER